MSDLAERFEVPYEKTWREFTRLGPLFLLLVVAVAAFASSPAEAAAIAAFGAIEFSALAGCLWLATRRQPAVFRITITDDVLRMPRWRSPLEDEMPLDQIAEIAVIHEKSCLNHVRVQIALNRQRRIVRSRSLQPHADFDALAQFLTVRLAARGVRVTRYSTRFGMRWPPQFSLARLLIVATCVAILLGIRSWLAPQLPALRPLPLAVLVGIGICGGLPFAMMASGSRILALGSVAYVIGATLEIRYVRDHLVGPGTFVPPTDWGSSTAFWWHCLNPSGRHWTTRPLSVGLGVFTSAILAAGVVMLVSLVVGYAVRRVTNRGTTCSEEGGRRE